MYSSLKNVQLLVAMLKEYGIRHAVISPGGNNVPVVYSLEHDSYFKCYSVVDERSAAYFAMGLAQQLEEAVILVCTSGTAVCNYLPGVTEAHYQRVPLVVITTDRSSYLLEQLETQKIDQMNIFTPVVNKDVCLPVIKNDDDSWYCSRLLNEALIELNHRIVGPIHINVPTSGGNPLDFSSPSLPTVRRIKLVKENELLLLSNQLHERLKNKRILLIIGENYKNKDDVSELINAFCSKYDAVCLKDYISNYSVDGVFGYRITESFSYEDFSKNLMPDLVISLENNILSNNLKNYLRNSKVEHWAIDPCGQIRDVFKNLSILFECSEESFFKIFNSLIFESRNKEYHELWAKFSKETDFNTDVYSDLYAVECFAKYLPDNSIVHTAILNSTRLFHFFENRKKIKVYSNIGALGIDGCLSTFIGSSFATDSKSFLIIGDLSFFYDMNALGITGIKNNARILLLNNTGGAEFHYNVGTKAFPSLDNYISVKHSKTARGWATSLGYQYLSATNSDELNENMSLFVGNSDKPILFEVFTDMSSDAAIVKKMLAANSAKRSTKSKIKGIVKSIIRK